MKRIKLGVLYKNMEGWIGGTYYIQNLISALNSLSDAQKPEIVLYSSTVEEFDQLKKIKYPYISSRELKEVNRQKNIIIRKLKRALAKLNVVGLFQPLINLKADDIDAIFPAPVSFNVKSNQKRIFWIPDFQELHYPQFFSSYEVKLRVQGHRIIANSTDTVIFSSEDVFNDFKKFYPGYKSQTEVIQFAVTHPSLSSLASSALAEKYGISKGYFISPNQFWAHKNHAIVIEAAKILKDQNLLNFEIVFTGKEEDYRNPDYAEKLKQKVKNLDLEKSIKFLGFIDRVDQLQLMKGALAVIQPSLFEGWSTVVEDTKSLNQHIIASDLEVHKEQLRQYPHLLFNRKDSNDLAEKIKSMTSVCQNTIVYDYDKDIRMFGEKFLKVLMN